MRTIVFYGLFSAVVIITFIHFFLLTLKRVAAMERHDSRPANQPGIETGSLCNSLHYGAE